MTDQLLTVLNHVYTKFEGYLILFALCWIIINLVEGITTKVTEMVADNWIKNKHLGIWKHKNFDYIVTFHRNYGGDWQAVINGELHERRFKCAYNAMRYAEKVGGLS